MDFTNWNKIENNSEAKQDEYASFVEWLSELTASEFRDAQSDVTEQKIACSRYFKRGYKAGLSTEELVDFLGVTNNCILERAEYSEDQFDLIMSITGSITDEEINNTEI